MTKIMIQNKEIHYLNDNNVKIGYAFINKDNKIYLIKCPKCFAENYALAVATGICAWCGFDANQEDIKS